MKTENIRKRVSLRHKKESLSGALMEKFFQYQIKDPTRVPLDDHFKH